MQAIRKSLLLGAAVVAGLLGSTAQAQSETALEQLELRAENRPLKSLARAAEASRGRLVQPGPPREVPNFRGQTGPNSTGPDPDVQAAVVQTAPGAVGVTVPGGVGFDGTDNATNGALLGFRIAPPDTDGHIGGANGQYFVQMINLLTTVFDRDGNELVAPFPSDEIWTGVGGNCEAYNQGDPIVLYDDQADRWLFSQFAFPDSLSSFSQCVAISASDDPRGEYNRYEFSFDGIGFNDYPKHGIVSDSITLMANLFTKRGRNFSFGGTYLAVLDKAAMYAGDPATMRGFNIGTGQFGFVAGDLDGPGTAPALFGTAMSTTNAFDIWQITPNWGGGSASISRIHSIPVTPFDRTLCGALRGACVPQPDNGPALESLSDRLMHRLQIRDFGGYRTMLAAHTVDAASNGVAGIRWYEFRNAGGDWSLYQEGTYAPSDGQYRWMPSIAMNGSGDIGVGFLLGGPNTYMSVAATGQSAAASGSGVFDAEELLCVAGGGVQEDVARSGDYSSTSVDPSDDETFWHTNEYVAVGGPFVWDTYVCPFTIGSGSGGGNIAPTAVITSINCTGLTCSYNGSGSSDSDGSITDYAWNFGDGSPAGTDASTGHTYASAGSYTVTLTVTDDDNATDVATAEITVNETSAAETLAVAAIAVTTVDLGGGNKAPRALVTILDNLGNPVSGATVTGDFSGDVTQADATGTTGGDGVATVDSSESRKGRLKFGFCVTGVSGSLTYEPADNAASCASN